MAANLKFNMADIEAKIEVAQYLEIVFILINNCAKFGAFITKMHNWSDKLLLHY